MKHIARFEKVSYEEFKKAFEKNITYRHFKPEEIQEIYEKIALPKRATTGSAGYDFFSPLGICINTGESVTIPTGIRCKMNEGWVLKLYPRSGLGFKHEIRLANTTGIIDSDYYNSDNEGHIMCKLVNKSGDIPSVFIHENTGFVQGIFVEYGITVDDDVTEVRNGGFGSTDK